MEQARYALARVSVDTLLEAVWRSIRAAQFVTAFSHEGYTTNVPLSDLLNGRRSSLTIMTGLPLAPAHGGPARLVVPHLYFWKSAKWVAGPRAGSSEDAAGFLGSARAINNLRRSVE